MSSADALENDPQPVAAEATGHEGHDHGPEGHNHLPGPVFNPDCSRELTLDVPAEEVTKARADTIEELAQKLDGVDAKEFVRHIADYNKAVRTDVAFNPNIKDGRHTEGLAVNKSNWANTIDEPPFEGYGVTCGLTFTFGGLRITTDGAVLNLDMQPIPGLYAAGELVGGLFYFNYPGGSGLTSGAVFGRIAGTSAARR